MGSTATRERIVDLLTTQLGNPKVREKDRSHLARLLEKNGRPCLDCKGYAEVCSKSMKCRKICPLRMHSCTTYLIPCDTCSETSQLYKPLFYTYDDKPCFNLVSGIMQAREDLWTKNSMRALKKDVEELKEAGRMLREEVQKLKSLKAITPNAELTTPTKPVQLTTPTKPVRKPTQCTDCDNDIEINAKRFSKNQLRKFRKRKAKPGPNRVTCHDCYDNRRGQKMAGGKVEPLPQRLETDEGEVQHTETCSL